MTTNDYVTEPQSTDTIKALWKVTKVVLDTLDFNEVTQKICDSLLQELDFLNLGYRIIVLSLYDEKANGLKRIALSQTPEARAAVDASTIPFHDILTPLSATDNYCVRVFLEQRPLITHDFKDLLSPPLQPEDARVNQRASGIKTSMVYPVILKGKSVGIVIFSMVKPESDVSESEKDLLRGFTDIIAVSVQNAQLYSQLENTTKRLNTANERLRALDKLKDEFLSLAGHELRTPMTAIKSYLWMVLNKKQSEDKITDKTQKYLTRSYESTERLINLVNDMLDVSRIESGRVELNKEEFSMCDIGVLVKEEVMGKLEENKLSMEILPCEDVPKVKADKGKIHQVLLNLVGNALKFTPAGGKITLAFKQKNGTVETAVNDTGKGISKEDQEKLFTKFGRLEGDYASIAATKGTGLGLYLCKQYVEMHKGKIWLESEVGKGTTFTFSLPAT